MSTENENSETVRSGAVAGSTALSAHALLREDEQAAFEAYWSQRGLGTRAEQAARKKRFEEAQAARRACNVSIDWSTMLVRR